MRKKLQLPKEARGKYFDKLFLVEMNNFDVELLLPTLFFTIRSRGRLASKRKDAQDVTGYLNKVLSHPRLEGFGEGERALLDRWLRTSVIRTGLSGLSRNKAEQILCVRPLTYLTPKTGFPAETSRHRNVPRFIYRLLYDYFASPGRPAGPELDRLFSSAFAAGLKLEVGESYGGTYDSKTPLDVESLLSICYMDGFEPAKAMKKQLDDSPPENVCPTQAFRIAEDLASFMVAYHDRLPPAALARDLMTLINFELFVYTLKLVYATDDLVRTGQLPPAMQAACDCEHSPPEIYLDFTRQERSPSDSIAMNCVRRDFEELLIFAKSVQRLRALDRFASASLTHKKLLQSNGERRISKDCWNWQTTRRYKSGLKWSTTAFARIIASQAARKRTKLARRTRPLACRRRFVRFSRSVERTTLIA